MTNPSFKPEAPAEEDPTNGAAVDAGSLFAPPEAPAEEEAEAVDSIFPPDSPSKNGADYSQNPAWKRIVRARDAAVLEVAPLKKRIAELEPLAEAMRKRFEGRWEEGKDDGGLAAMEYDATFADTFETLMKDDPEVQSVARKVVQAMSGQTPTPVATPAAKATAAPARDERVELLLQDRAQEKVTGALKEMGIVDAKVGGMAQYIIRHAADPARLDEAQIMALGRKYVAETGFTQAELTGETNGKAPRRPASGGSRSATSTAAPAETDEKPEPEFKDRKGYLAFKEQMIRKMTA
jgi:hypothetical protein